MLSKPWDILDDFSYSTSKLVVLALPSYFVTGLASASPPVPPLRAPSLPAAQLWWPLLGPLCSLYSNLYPVTRRALSGTYYWFLFAPTNPLWFPISCTKSRALYIPTQTPAPIPLACLLATLASPLLPRHPETIFPNDPYQTRFPPVWNAAPPASSLCQGLCSEVMWSQRPSLTLLSPAPALFVITVLSGLAMQDLFFFFPS